RMDRIPVSSQDSLVARGSSLPAALTVIERIGPDCARVEKVPLAYRPGARSFQRSDCDRLARAQLLFLRRGVRPTAAPPPTRGPAAAARQVSSAPVRGRSDPPAPFPSSSPSLTPPLPSSSATTENEPVRASSSSVSLAPVTSRSYWPR